MTQSKYLSDLERKLHEIESRIKAARARVDAGKPADVVAASGELAVLEAKHKELEEKVDRARTRHTEDWSIMHTELVEDYDNIMSGISKWVSRH